MVLQRAVAAGQPLRWDDVAADPAKETIRFRRKMKDAFRSENAGAPPARFLNLSPGLGSEERRHVSVEHVEPGLGDMGVDRLEPMKSLLI